MFSTARRSCDKPQDLDNFFEIFKNFSLVEDIHEEIHKFGCGLPNCEEIIWNLREMSGHEDEVSEVVHFGFFLPTGQVTKVSDIKCLNLYLEV